MPEGFIEATPPPEFDLDPAVAAVYRSIGMPLEAEKPTQIVALDQFGVPIPDVDPIPLVEPPPAPETPVTPAGPETPLPADPPKPPETPPADPPKPTDPPKSADPAPAPEPSVMDRLGKAVDKLAEKLDAPPVSAPAAPAQPDVDPRIALRLEALATLEQSPTHRGQPLVAQYKTFLTKFAAYQTEWERANAGKAFDPNDEDHEAFVSAHSPKVTDDEIIRAEARVETLREVETRMAQERQARAAQESEKFARESAARAPELLLSELEAKSVDELKGKDPALAFAANELLGQVPAIVRATHQVFSGRLNEADPMHANIVKTFERYDAALAAAPVEQSRSPDGRAYVPLAKWGTLTPSQRAQSWTLAAEPEELSRMVVREAAGAVKARAEQVRAWFPAPAAAAPLPVVPPPAPAPKPAAPAPTPTPPSGGDAPPVAPGTTAGKPPGQSFVQYF